MYTFISQNERKCAYQIYFAIITQFQIGWNLEKKNEKFSNRSLLQNTDLKLKSLFPHCILQIYSLILLLFFFKSISFFKDKFIQILFSFQTHKHNVIDYVKQMKIDN